MGCLKRFAAGVVKRVRVRASRGEETSMEEAFLGDDDAPVQFALLTRLLFKEREIRMYGKRLPLIRTIIRLRINVREAEFGNTILGRFNNG
jgi:hypothetical protein